MPNFNPHTVFFRPHTGAYITKHLGKTNPGGIPDEVWSTATDSANKNKKMVFKNGSYKPV